ncbi:hypothetical protein [Sporomusa sp. KB1]|uniref:hypothetical protein n=1 Tax=Sporomusa sp. KB1 TaxID=943346 RepID=UPI0011A01830|nr:hypothetical protein [Sporomusa sp. KB1]TWH46861.1 hypothetical protein Salpa_2884 [Sporomusa sp. KB1]
MGAMIEEIDSLKKQMVGLGYVEGEVNAFIHDAIGDKPISKLSNQEYKDLIDYLNSYLLFAKKSKGLVSSH